MKGNRTPINLPVNTGFYKVTRARTEEPEETAPAASGKAAATQRKAAADLQTGTGMVLSAQLMDAKTAFELGVTGVGQAEADATHSVLVYEIYLMFGDPTIEVKHGIVWMVRDVVGFQASFRLTRLDLGIKANLTNVSLAAQFGLAESNFAADSDGISIIGKKPNGDVLDKEDGLTKVIEFLGSCRDRLANGRAKINTERRSFSIGTVATNEWDEDQAIIFALRGIEKQLTLHELLEKNASIGHDHNQITATYQHITESFDDTAKPTEDHGKKAGKLLRFAEVEDPMPEESTN